MIRFVFRFIGLWILAAGFVALVRDGTKSIAGNAIFITRLGEDWNNLHAASQDALNALVTRYAGPAAWELVTLSVIRLCRAYVGLLAECAMLFRPTLIDTSIPARVIPGSHSERGGSGGR